MVDKVKLDGFNPVGKNKRKKQIILTHTSRNISDYLKSLRYRYNGNYKKLPNYIIDREGVVYEIISPNTYSEYMDYSTYNKNSIIICLENLGWLRKNPLDGSYVNWIGDIYKESIYERKWRTYHFWQPYTEEQINVLSSLVNEVCDEFNIPKKTIGHNVEVDKIDKYNGIVTNSNFSKENTDLNPSFNFETLQKKITDEQPV